MRGDQSEAALRVVDIRDEKSHDGGVGTVWDAESSDGSTRVFRLSRPHMNLWRLQIGRADGSFDDRGACQILAEELGERIEEQPADPGVSLREEHRVSASTHPEPDIELTREPMVLRFFADTRPDSEAGRRTGGERRNVARSAGYPRGEKSVRRARLTIDMVAEENGVFRVSGPLDQGEKLYGGGQRFDSVQRRGTHIKVWSEDRWCETEGNSYMPAPMTISSAGYAWLVNRFEGMEIDLGATQPDRWSIANLEAPLDLYICLADDPREILSRLTAYTGRAPAPPEWAFGVLVSRHGRTREFSSTDGVREMMQKMDEHDLPWSGVILEGWPTYDTSRYPELSDLVAQLHEAGKKVLMYDACGRVRSGADRYCLKRRDGGTDIEESHGFNPADAPDRKSSRWLDITNEEAWRWWSEAVWGELLDRVGVDGAKIDFCEQIPEHEDLSPADGRSPKGLHHYWPVKYNTLMYRLFNERRPEGGVCWSRGGGGIGAARYPWPWCGDQLREWRFLEAILRSALSSGLSGLPLMGHDLGGYRPTRDPEANPEAEVFARGCQLACFHPMMSTHGTVTRPYDFPPEIVDIYRLYSRIHYALIPYLVEQVRAGCAAGIPAVRHLVLLAPEDRVAADCESEYMLGEDLLIAPVLGPGESRDIYLPEGEWEELYDGTLHQGPVDLAGVHAPLDRAPVFIRRPSASPLLAKAVERIREIWRRHVASLGSRE